MKENLGAVAVAAEQFTKERDYWLKKLSGEWVKGRFPYDNKKGAAVEEGKENGNGFPDFRFPGPGICGAVEN